MNEQAGSSTWGRTAGEQTGSSNWRRWVLGGYAMVLMLYVLRSDALAKTALGCCINLATWRAGLAFIPINLYNGKRGFVRGPILKYAFYAAYPLHLLVIWHMRLRLGI